MDIFDALIDTVLEFPRLFIGCAGMLGVAALLLAVLA